MYLKNIWIIGKIPPICLNSNPFLLSSTNTLLHNLAAFNASMDSCKEKHLKYALEIILGFPVHTRGYFFGNNLLFIFQYISISIIFSYIIPKNISLCGDPLRTVGSYPSIWIPIKASSPWESIHLRL